MAVCEYRLDTCYEHESASPITSETPYTRGWVGVDNAP